MKKPELLAPGGGFDAAFQAFEAGADGVYLGLGEFSARKSAVNFTLAQLRRIRALALARGGKIYVTINTVIKDEELPRLAETLGWLEAIQVDGVIVQDVGACRLVTRGYPGLPVFASTQMAIHNDAGLRQAEELGIRRVILSRELTLEAIRDLRTRHPGIELEVFIHGALCYSFSGACLASWALTGRSGNRGECAQICRSLFRTEDRSCEEGHFFSCRDLALGTEVLKLAALGIDSFKIEGRMKSPEYVYHVTHLYRRILDDGAGLDPQELEALTRNAQTAFSRTTTTGYFSSPHGSRLLERGFPGHRGSLLGVVTGRRGTEFELTLRADVSLHDGVGYWLPGATEPLILSVSGITRGGKQVRFARAGEAVFLAAVETPSQLPAVGSEVSIFSSRFLDRPKPREAATPLVKVPVDLRIELRKNDIGGELSCTGAGRAEGFSFSRPVTLDSASGGKAIADVLAKVFHESADSVLAVGKLSIVNSTGLGDAAIFIPPSQVKKTKNEMYAALEAWHESALKEKARAACAMTDEPLAPAGGTLPLAALPDRDRISPPGQRPVPFASLAAGKLDPDSPASLGGFTFLPLPPVLMNDAQWLAALRQLAEASPSTRFAVGLNNISHVAIAHELASFENVFFFADFFLYAANHLTVSFLAAHVQRLLFAYSWIEGGDEGSPASGAGDTSVPIIRISPSFEAPLFYSLGCYERHGKGGGACLDNCPRDSSVMVRQGRNRFRLVVRDCVTYLFHSSTDFFSR